MTMSEYSLAVTLLPLWQMGVNDPCCANYSIDCVADAADFTDTKTCLMFRCEAPGLCLAPRLLMMPEAQGRTAKLRDEPQAQKEPSERTLLVRRDTTRGRRCTSAFQVMFELSTGEAGASKGGEGATGWCVGRLAILIPWPGSRFVESSKGC
jgi:hypothetical protein